MFHFLTRRYAVRSVISNATPTCVEALEDRRLLSGAVRVVGQYPTASWFPVNMPPGDDLKVSDFKNNAAKNIADTAVCKAEEVLMLAGMAPNAARNLEHFLSGKESIVRDGPNDALSKEAAASPSINKLESDVFSQGQLAVANEVSSRQARSRPGDLPYFNHIPFPE